MPESDVKANNMYSHIKFPDYEYRPYPRMMYDAEGVGTVVLSEAEETDWRTAVALQEAREESAPLGTDAIATVSATLGKLKAEDALPRGASPGYSPKGRG